MLCLFLDFYELPIIVDQNGALPYVRGGNRQH